MADRDPSEGISPLQGREDVNRLLATGPNEFHCPICGLRCTRSPSDRQIEYGHQKWSKGNARIEGACPRRPAGVDTARKGGPV